MIRIIENSDKKLIIKNYPTKYWLAFIVLTILTFALNYGTFYLAPIYSSLTCNRSWLNKTHCEIREYSLLDRNRLQQTVNNLNEPKKILRNGTIWLTTEVDLLHNRIGNIYYPSHSFLGFFDIYLYRFRGQAVREVDRINDFVRHKNNRKNLILIRKIPGFYYIFLLLLPLTIVMPIILIFIQPINTYVFDRDKHHLVVRNNISSRVEKKIYPLASLKVISSIKTEDDRKLIILNADEQKLATFNNFLNELEALNTLNLLKQYIK